MKKKRSELPYLFEKIGALRLSLSTPAPLYNTLSRTPSRPSLTASGVCESPRGKRASFEFQMKQNFCHRYIYIYVRKSNRADTCLEER